MFDIGWGEFVLIGAVALVVIGPKELPGVLRTVGQTIGKARRMASDFQGQFREVLREAEIEEARSALTKGINEGFSGTTSIGQGSGSSSAMTPEYKPPQIPLPDAPAAETGSSPTAADSPPVASEPIIPPAPPVPDLTPDQISAAFAPAEPSKPGSPAGTSVAASQAPAAAQPPASSAPSAAAPEAKPARSRRKAAAPPAAEAASVGSTETAPARKSRSRALVATGIEGEAPKALPAPRKRAPRKTAKTSPEVAANDETSNSKGNAG